MGERLVPNGGVMEKWKEWKRASAGVEEWRRRTSAEWWSKWRAEWEVPNGGRECQSGNVSMEEGEA